MLVFIRDILQNFSGLDNFTAQYKLLKNLIRSRFVLRLMAFDASGYLVTWLPGYLVM